MVRCNLAILLAERNLKITLVSNETGISRTTLTSLANNYSKGIQFETLNTLCNYLKVTPNQLLSYLPIDITIKKIEIEEKLLKIELLIHHKGIVETHSIYGKLDFSFHKENLTSWKVFITLTSDDEQTETNRFIKDAFQALPVPFFNDVQQEISNSIHQKLLDEFKISNRDYHADATISWADEFFRGVLNG